MIGLVLVTHGNLANEFVAAMQHVVGPQENVATVCIGPEDDMESRRQEILNKVGEVDNGSGTQDVQIILIDANGQRTVYQGAQKAGVRIRQKVEVTGSGKVQFFCNNKMVEEKNL